MPKMKTHRGAAKRFRFTGSGKIRRRRAYRNHILEKMPAKTKRKLAGDPVVSPANAKTVRRMLGK